MVGQLVESEVKRLKTCKGAEKKSLSRGTERKIVLRWRWWGYSLLHMVLVRAGSSDDGALPSEPESTVVGSRGSPGRRW